MKLQAADVSLYIRRCRNTFEQEPNDKIYTEEFFTVIDECDI